MQDNQVSREINNLLGTQTQKKIIFLTKYPNDCEKKDGFFQRVLRIDYLFKDYLRIYVNVHQNNVNFEIIQIDQLCYQININLGLEISSDVLNAFSQSVSIVYAHSIYSLTNLIGQTLFANSNYAIWDVHGVVPEEESFINPTNADNIRLTSEAELFAYSNVRLIISVSNKLTKHLQNKYSNISNHPQYILMPIFANDSTTGVDKKLAVKPVVIYSGGIQAWQQVSKMLHYIYNNKNSYTFIFLVSDVTYVKNLYLELFGEDFPGILKSVAPEDVTQYYTEANFGLIFREDNLINNVSCPTKLIEYLAYGIIPIVISDKIGDFKELGYVTLNENDVIELSQSKYSEIININFKVIKSFYEASNLGTDKLYSIIANTGSLVNSIPITALDILNLEHKYLIKLKESNQIIANLNEKLAVSEQKLAASVQKIFVLESSTSWKITAPLRNIMDLLKKKLDALKQSNPINK